MSVKDCLKIKKGFTDPDDRKLFEKNLKELMDGGVPSTDAYPQAAELTMEAILDERNELAGEVRDAGGYLADISIEELLTPVRAVPEKTAVEKGKGLYSGYEIPEITGRTPDSVREDAPEQRDLFTATTVPDEAVKPQAVDNFEVEFKHAEAAQLRSGFDVIDSPEKAAHLIAPIRKHAQETFMIIVTDKDKKVLNVIRHTKGGIASSSVFPTTVLGAIASTEGAANYWMAHNHPAGLTKPSQSDYAITNEIIKQSDGMDINYEGHLVVGEGRSFDYFVDHDDNSYEGKITPARRSKTISVTERVIKKRGKRDVSSLTTSTKTKSYIESLGSDSGIILMDNRHSVSGVITITPDEMAKLRDGKQVKRILSGIDKTNAVAVITFIKQDLPGEDARFNLLNLGNFIAKHEEVRLLDGIYYDSSFGGLVAMAERGVSPGSKDQPFYSRAGKPDSALVKMFDAIANIPDAFQNKTSSKKDLAGIVSDVGGKAGLRTEDGTIVTGEVTDETGKWFADLLTIFDEETSTPFVQIFPGKKFSGSKIYQIAMMWAHNNGKTLRPDPAGTTAVNRLRRSEAMVSSMLRYNSHAHLEPGADQYVGLLDDEMYNRLTDEMRKDGAVKPPADIRKRLDTLKEMVWDPSNFEKSLHNLLLNNANIVERRLLRAKKNGQSRKDVESKGTAGIGRSTLRRYDVTRSLLHEKGDVGLGERVWVGAEAPQSLDSTLPLLEKSLKRLGLVDTGIDPGYRTAYQNLLYKRQQGSGSTKTQVDNWISKPKSKLGNWISVEVVQGVDELPPDPRTGEGHPDDVRGMRIGDTVYLVADNITDSKDSMLVLSHEVVGHAGLERLLGKAGMASLVKQIQQYKRDGKKEITEIIDELKLTYVDKNGKYNLSEQQESSEVMAKLAEVNPDFGFVRKIMNKIKFWLTRHGFGRFVDFDNVHLESLLIRAAQTSQTNYSGFMEDSGKLIPSYMVAKEEVADIEQSEYEQAVAKGLPMDKESRMQRARDMGFDVDTVWYHGSRADIDSFSQEFLGENTGAQSAKKGFFFTASPIVASGYAAIGDSRHVIELKKSMKRMVSEARAKGDEFPLSKRDNKDLQKVKAELERIEFVGDTKARDAGRKSRKLAEQATEALWEMHADSDIKNFDEFIERNKNKKEIKMLLGRIETGKYRYFASGSNVTPVYAKYENTFIFDYEGKKYREETYVSIISKALKAGHDSVLFKNTFDGGSEGYNELTDILYIKNQENIRSTSAAFDPEFKDSPNLLYSRKPQTDSRPVAMVVGKDEDGADREPSEREKPAYSRRHHSPTETTREQEIEEEVLVKLGMAPQERRGVLRRIKDLKSVNWKEAGKYFGQRANEGIFDGLAGFKYAEESVGAGIGVGDYEGSAYVSARLATGVSDMMTHVLHYGALEWKDGVPQAVEGTQGFLDIMGELGEQADNFLMWMAGNRAEELMDQNREQNLTVEDIEFLKAKSSGHVKKFKEAKAKYNTMNKAMLNFAEDAGLINPESRAEWESEWYIPFYRQLDDEVLSPHTKRGLSHQTAGIKHLSGADAPTADLLENVLSNWMKLVDASVKNMAMVKMVNTFKDSDYISHESLKYTKAMVPKSQVAKMIQEDRDFAKLAADYFGLPEVANELDIIQELKGLDKEGFNEFWAITAPEDPRVLRIKRNGKNEYWRVNEGYDSFLRATGHLQFEGFQDPVTRVARYMKQLLTLGVTTSPDFMLRNFIRDAAHAWAINKDGFKFGVDSLKGLKAAAKEDSIHRTMMAGGASFQGGYVHGTDPEATAHIMRRQLEKKGLTRLQIDSHMNSVLDTPSKLWGAVEMGWQKYRSAGDKIENANRIATAKASLEAGKHIAQVLYESKDLMDYSLRGNYQLLMRLTDVVPFLNARLQGTSKLVRAGYQDPKIILKKTAYIAAFSVALAMWNDDDERYQELQDWEKDAYWHVFLGDEHFRIPKPFEIGIVAGTIPERIYHTWVADNQPNEKLLWSLKHGAMETLGINPMPQALIPIYEVASNKSMYFKTPIESMSDEGISSRMRYNAYTSDMARYMGDTALAEWIGISPKQLEHLWKGYTGTMGGYALTVSDMIIRVGTDAPDKPEYQLSDYPLLKSVYRGKTAKSTQYHTDFYDRMTEVEEIYRTINVTIERGDKEQAKELRKEHKEKLGTRTHFKMAQRQLKRLRNQMKQLLDSDKSADVKYREKQSIQKKMNRITKRISEKTQKAFE